MSFAKNECQQLTLNDSTFSLTVRELRMLERSWAKQFAEKIFPQIDEEKFSVLYSDKASRPNTPVNVIVGGMVLQELLDLTDEEFMDSLLFDIRFQYASIRLVLKNSRSVTGHSVVFAEDALPMRQRPVLI